MPPRSRRRAAREAAAAPKQEEQLDDDFDFEADVESIGDGAGTVDFSEDIDFEEEVAPAPARRSRRLRSAGEETAGDGRRGARSSNRGSAHVSTRGRSARSERLVGASQRKKNAKSERKRAKKAKALTPEEIEARRRARKNGILLTLLMVGIFGAGNGFYFAVMYVPQERKDAQNHLRMAKVRLDNLTHLINVKDTEGAEGLIDSAVEEHLAIPMFGFASVPNPDPQDPGIIDVKLARKAYELKVEFESRSDDIVRIREDVLAKKNHDLLLKRLSNLGPDVEPDLGAVREAVGAFLANPSFPEQAANPELAERYKNQFVMPVRNMVIEIDREAQRRLSAETVDVFATVNSETDLMMRKMRYGDALRYVDEIARNETAASLGPIRQKILDSARLKWESERERARNNYHLSVDPSSAPGQRDEAEQRARTILRDVISSFGEGVSGVDEFVQEARRLQSEFGY